MTTIHRKSLDGDRLGTYIKTTNGFVDESLTIPENRPKTRLLLTKRFWKFTLSIYAVVVLLASYSGYQLLIVQNRNSEELRQLKGMSAAASELLANTLATNLILSEIRFTGATIQSNQIQSLDDEINNDLARIELLAFELQDREIQRIIDSLISTMKSWNSIFAYMSPEAYDRNLEFAEVELMGASARSIELLESQLHLRINSEETNDNNQIRTALIIGVASMLFGILSTALLIPIAIAGSIERLVIMQKTNRAKERQLGLATSSFLDNVNLKLRTPLTSISGFSEILSNADNSINQNQKQRMIHTIYRNSQKLNELVDNVLTMCRIQTHEVRFKFTEFDAREVLRAEVERRQELTRITDVEINLTSSATPIPIVGDFEEISRAIRALLDNAITYSRNDGVVEVSVRRDDDLVEGPMAVFVISDRGIGIPSNELAVALDAFERGSNAVALSINGAGLGLSIVDFIVFEHGGEWKMTSVENEGTQVELRFPCLRNVSNELSRFEITKEVL